MANRPYDIIVRLRDGVTARVRTMRASLKGITSSLFNIKTAALGAAAALGVFTAGRAVKNFLGGAISEARDFESQMAKVRAVTGATGEEFDALNKAARDAGASTIFTAREAGGGLEELSRAGFNATDSIKALNSVLQFAQANAIGVSESATQITTSIKQFGLTADDASRVADVLTKTAASSATNVQQLGNAMSYAAPLARQAGVSIEQTSAIIGSLADQGFRGERAGTALRQAFALLQDPASKTAKALDAAGISSRNFTDIIGELEGNADKAKQVLLSLPLEVRPAIAALVQQGSARIRQLTGDLNDAAGATKTAADVMNDNLDGALKGLSSAFSDLKIELVTPLVKALTTEIKNLTEKLRNFTKSDALQRLKTDLVEGFKSAAAAVKEFLQNFDFQAATESLGRFVRSIGSNGQSLIGTFQVLASGAKVIADSVKLAFSAIDALTSSTVAGLTKVGEWMLRIINLSPSYRAVFGDLSEEIRSLQEVSSTSYNRAVDAVYGFRDASVDLANAVTGLGDKMGETSRETRDLGQAGHDARQGLDDATEGIEGVKTASGQAPPSIEAATAAIGEMSQSAAEAAANLERQRQAIENQNEGLQQQGGTVNEVTGQLSLYQKVLKILKGDTKDAGDETERTRDKTKEFGDQTEKTSEKTKRGTESFKKFGEGAAAAAQVIGSIIGRYKELGGTVGQVGQKIIQEAGRMESTVLAFFRGLGQSLGRLEDKYQANARAFDKWSAQLESGQISAQRFVAEIRSAIGETGLLDQQRLDKLHEVMRQAQEDAARLRAQFESLNDSIERDFLSATGKQGELIKSEFDQRRAELEQSFKSLSTAEQNARRDEYQKSLERLRKLEQLKLDELQQQQAQESQLNQQTFDQREQAAKQYHENELNRAQELARAHFDPVATYREAKAAADDYYDHVAQREQQQHEQRMENVRAEEEEKRKQIATTGGLLKGARQQQPEIKVRLLSDTLNGQRVQLDPQQMDQMLRELIQRINQTAGLTGLRVSAG